MSSVIRAFSVTGRGLGSDDLTVLITQDEEVARQFVATALVEMPGRDWRILHQEFPSLDALREAREEQQRTPYASVWRPTCCVIY